MLSKRVSVLLDKWFPDGGNRGLFDFGRCFSMFADRMGKRHRSAVIFASGDVGDAAREIVSNQT